MTDKITLTLAEIRAHKPCARGWKTLCESLGGIEEYGKNTPLTFRQIYESNGYNDTLWCLRVVDRKHHHILRHFAVDCAESVKHLTTDKRSLNALVVARKHADGEATDNELTTANNAAFNAAYVAYKVADAASSAADAAYNASNNAVHNAAYGAAYSASFNDADAARKTIRISQMELLFKYCETGERVESKMKKRKGLKNE